MKERILITGHKGFIGSHLVPLLGDYDVEGIDLQDRKDIFHHNDLDYLVFNSDVVIHLAARVGVGDSFEQRGDYIRTNVLGTAAVCEAVDKYKRKLIYASSAAVLQPESSPYAQSKALAEEIVKKFMWTNRATILRFYNVYGVGMNPAYGSVMWEFIKGTYDGVLKINGDGHQTRDFIDVDSIVHIIRAAVLPKWDGQTVEVGTGQEISINDLAKMFQQRAKILNMRVPRIEHYPDRYEIRHSKANTTMLGMLYGVEANGYQTLKKNIESLIRWGAVYGQTD